MQTRTTGIQTSGHKERVFAGKQWGEEVDAGLGDPGPFYSPANPEIGN